MKKIALFAFIASVGLQAGEVMPGPFGIGSCHVNNRSARDNERWMPQMEKIGLKYNRSAHTGWGEVEPEEGKWHWQTLDEQLAYFSAHHFETGGMLIGNPKWNSLDARGNLPVNHLAGWSSYVKAVVGHAKDRIKLWEVWNEPPNFTGREQTPADYAKIVMAAYDAAKAADPECRVGLAAKSAHINYLEQVIKAGAKDHFDYITLHPYEVLDGIVDNAGTEAVYMNIVPALRKMLTVQNPAKALVPVIFTELGCDVKKGADAQAHALIKAYTMGIAQGVSCIHWFEGRDGDSGPLGLLDGKGEARPAYTAMAQMIEHLGQRPDYLGWVLLNGKHYGFVFQGPKGAVLVTWAYRGMAEKVSLGEKVAMVDAVSGARTEGESCVLSSAPVFVLNVPPVMLEQAKRNQGKALPWGGDFSHAKTVSITMGDHAEEKGLHSRSGDAVAAAVLGYGGSARAGNVPGGNLFLVDPGFLSYEAVPIEISVVVRRNPANDNAGFKLVYESTNGFKTAGGWYTVPDNKEWHTVRWKIKDPQFVNYWGYNFSLVSDGNVFNKYYIQSVTVTKLDE
ncbi:hypothetical protein [Prosthecobacter sp.]|uniref:hypothetical protein n=1 Tax=Prosthecobacter sp. TaxID=1965333 RepID=UPI0037836BC1